MAYSYVFTDQALEELDQITAYVSMRSGSQRPSERLLEDVEKSIGLICDNPTMFALSRFGSLAQQGYRSALVGSYVLLYRFEGDVVYIAHIFHQRQDYATLV